MQARILIVEDEGIIALDLASRVTSMDCEVVGPAASADQALALVEVDAAVDLALVDVRLGGREAGPELARVLHERHGIPSIFITAQSDEATLARLCDALPLGYLSKPLDNHTPEATIAAALSVHRASLRRAERQGSERREDGLLAAILDHSCDGIISIDARHQIAVFNRGAQAMFGYAPEEVLGAQVDVLLREEDRARHRPMVDAFREGTPSGRRMGGSLEVWARHKEGRLFPVEVSISRVVLPEGVMMTAMVRDLTARRALEERVATSERLEALGRLAGGVAHDFNNLLTAVLGYATLLDASLSGDDPRRSDVAEIRRAGERAQKLVKELLAYGSRTVVRNAAFELNGLVDDAVEGLRTELGPRLRLRVALEEGLPLVSGDRERVQQAVANLVRSAQTTPGAGGEVRVTTRLADGQALSTARPSLSARRAVVVEVCGMGPGMDEVTRRRIFEPFFTSDTRRVAQGIGLAAAYGTVRQAGGVILVAGGMAGGSCFQVFLPVDEVEATAGEAGPVPQPAPTPQGAHTSPAGLPTVLLVDDEALVRDLAARLLSDHGYEVLTACDGAEAWRLIQEHGLRIGLLLTDVVMPGMDGFELVERWQAHRPGAPALLMTGFSERALDLPDVSASDLRVIEKPFSPEELVVTIASMVGGG